MQHSFGAPSKVPSLVRSRDFASWVASREYSSRAGVTANYLLIGWRLQHTTIAFISTVVLSMRFAHDDRYPRSFAAAIEAIFHIRALQTRRSDSWAISKRRLKQHIHMLILVSR